MYGKTFKIKTICLAAILLTCTAQNAMEKYRRKKLLLLKRKKATPGFICNKEQRNSKQFLVVTEHKKLNLEIWNKRLDTRHDTINSETILDVLFQFYRHDNFVDEVKDHFTNQLRSYMQKAKMKDSSTMIIDTQFEEKTNTRLHLQYRLENRNFKIVHIPKDEKNSTNNTYTIKPGANNTIMVYHKDLTKPVIIHVPKDYDWDTRSVFCGNNHIVIKLWHDRWPDHSHIHIYDVKTGEPRTIQGKIVNLRDTIENWTWEKKLLKDICFGKNDAFMILSLHTYNDDIEDFLTCQKQLILFDLHHLQPVGQHTFPQTFGPNTTTANSDNDLGIHLLKNEKEILVISNIEKKAYIFHNPLVKIDLDETERKIFAQKHDTIRSKGEKKAYKIIINKDIVIPVNRSILLMS